MRLLRLLMSMYHPIVGRFGRLRFPGSCVLSRRADGSRLQCRVFEGSMVRPIRNCWRGPLGVTVALAMAACAAPTPVRVTPDSSALVNAAALIRRGCYHCLESAFDAVVGRSPQMTFEVAALLALRSKELGLPPDVWLERARDVLPANPALNMYFEMVSAVRADPLSDDRDVIFTESPLRRINRETAAAGRAGLTADRVAPLLRAAAEPAVTAPGQPHVRHE